MSPFRLTRTRSFGLRPRLMALVLAAVAPFVFLIGMVARQHRFNERANAEDAALDQASRLADRLDSRFGAVETLLLTLVHSVSPNPRDSLRNDKLLRDVVKELDDEIVRRGLHDPSMSFIQKPFTADNLAMQVRKVLDAA
jgi:hypothetical protein